MLLGFLKQKYSKQIIGASINSSLKSWTRESNLLTRKFAFDNFQNAVTFQSIIASYLSNSKLEFQVNNVYNSVTLKVDEEISERDVKILENIDHLYSKHLNLCNETINGDLVKYAASDRLALRNNIQNVATSYKHEQSDFFEDVKLLH